MNRIFVYNDITINNENLAVRVNYDAVRDFETTRRETTSNRNVFVLEFSPILAESITRELTELGKWYKNPLYQWAKKKTDIDKQINFRR